MIEVAGLTKRYAAKLAVDDLSFTVRSGEVTGFLGPNGAGKSTAMRCILGLDKPDAGSVRINGRVYRDSVAPIREVGALLEARAIHGGRSAYHHLLALAVTHGIGKRRIAEVLELVGLDDVARQRVGTFSLGMGQRLGIAAAMLGDPGTLLLDEPVNGLDPEGIRWVRLLLRGLAAEGRTVFVSSHLMSEMALTAEQLVVVGRGRLIAETSVAEFTQRATQDTVLVRSPDLARLTAVLADDGLTGTVREDGALLVSGVSAAVLGDLALQHRIAVHELTPVQASLEEAFMALTASTVDYRAQLEATA